MPYDTGDLSELSILLARVVRFHRGAGLYSAVKNDDRSKTCLASACGSAG